ncbi:MAG: threonylcarbamoyl-AMP synthase [Candidatus Micrarchaeota archaeon]|nr:threonylcarbamoyl-AMP synthase [Candidatus Micrarchaeota archaeon]
MVRVLRASASAVSECANALSEGKVVAYPTETVYGLGVDSANRKALKRLFQVKKRDETKPSSVAVANVERAEEIAVFNSIAKMLAKKFLPGPLTLVVKAIAPIPLISLNGKVGIRIPSNEFSQQLLQKFPNPITATSANISGQESVTRASDLDKTLLERVDIAVDAAESRYKQGSTVVEVLDSSCRILREGAITRQAIESAVLTNI